MLLETLQTSDESEFHLESWHADEITRTLGEFEDAVENWEPTTVRRESPDDGALKRVSDVTSITSKENKLDALDVCDCRETRTPKFNPDPWDNLAVMHESESQFRAENAVLDVAL